MEKHNFLLKKKEKKAIKILKHSIDGSDRIWLWLQGFSDKIQFNPNEMEIILGGKVIEPMLSYAINSWNVMLPYITYQIDKEKVLAYLETIKYEGRSEA